MAEEFSYVDERLEDQQKWHSDKAMWNKKRFYIVEIITLLAGATIPVINVLAVVPDPWLRVVSAVLASVIVVANGIGKLYKFQENWLTFRGLAEVLKREREFYLNEIGEYAVRGDRARNKILVERVENLLTGTTSAFLSVHKAEGEIPQLPLETSAPEREETSE